MRAPALVLAVTAAALALVGAAIRAGGDSTVFVPPPEAVAESFMHQIQARRYDRALQYVDPSTTISESTIRVFAAALEAREGTIEQLEGESSSIEGDSATATVKMTMQRGARLRPAFSLTRRFGEWRIIDWTER